MCAFKKNAGNVKTRKYKFVTLEHLNQTPPTMEPFFSLLHLSADVFPSHRWMSNCQQSFWSAVYSVFCVTLNEILSPICPCTYIISLLLSQVDQLTSQLAVRVSSTSCRVVSERECH